MRAGLHLLPQRRHPRGHRQHRPPDAYTGTPGRSGRVSIYLATNGADFLPQRIPADSDFALALAAVRGSLPINEVHFTGGEPTLHPDLPGLIRIARRLDLTVGLTSNGENGAAVLPTCAEAGLDRINLSVFGSTPDELAAVQAPVSPHPAWPPASSTPSRARSRPPAGTA